MSNYKHVAYITLFENEPNGNKPVLSGTLEMPDGRKMKVSLWKKVAKDGVKHFFSGSVQQEDGGSNGTVPVSTQPSIQAVPTPSFQPQYTTNATGSTTVPVTATVPEGYNVKITSGGGTSDLPF